MLLALFSAEQSQKKKVIFFGDSITEVGVKPGGYILKVADLAAKENKTD